MEFLSPNETSTTFLLHDSVKTLVDGASHTAVERSLDITLVNLWTSLFRVRTEHDFLGVSRG